MSTKLFDHCIRADFLNLFEKMIKMKNAQMSQKKAPRMKMKKFKRIYAFLICVLNIFVGMNNLRGERQNSELLNKLFE